MLYISYSLFVTSQASEKGQLSEARVTDVVGWDWNGLDVCNRYYDITIIYLYISKYICNI